MPTGIYVRTENHKAAKRTEWTPERKAAASARMTGKPNTVHSAFMMGNQNTLGYRHSSEAIAKRSGPNHYRWKGGCDDYGLDWPKQRALAFARDNGTCQLGMMFEWKPVNKETTGREPDVHHVDGDKKNNNLDNLVTLCLSCHAWVEPRI